MMNYQKNIMKLCEPVYNEKHLKAKINLIMEKPKQISPIIKHQKKVLNVFF